MASPVRHVDISSNGAFAFSQTSALKPHPIASRAACASVVTALSVEFVAKPQEAHRVQATIPAAVAGALKEVSGFAGCLVMISDQEARLVTVVTLWAGEDGRKRCDENTRWVHALLAPYLDRCLRVQTMVAHLPVLAAIQPQGSEAGVCSMVQQLPSEDESVCVA